MVHASFYGLIGFASGVMAGAYVTFRHYRRHIQQEAHWSSLAMPSQMALQDLQRQFGRWRDFLKTLFHTLSQEPLSQQTFAQTLADTASTLFNSEKVLILALDPRTLSYRPLAHHGFGPQWMNPLDVSLGKGLLGKAIQQGTIAHTASASSQTITPLPEEGFLTIPNLLIPIRTDHRIVALMALCQPLQGAYSPQEIEQASLMAAPIGLVWENMELKNHRTDLYRTLVHTLIQMVQRRRTLNCPPEEYTRHLVRAMAEEIHLPHLLIEQIQYGALLRDIGKIGIAEAILLKAEALTAEEQQLLRQHPVIGHRILHTHSFLTPAALIILYHQEWFNGQGYPEGLAGEEIPLGARIVSIIDAWEAMTMDRPFRKAMAPNVAAAELRRQAGTQFDPKVVEAFLHVIDRLESDVRMAAPSPTAL